MLSNPPPALHEEAGILLDLFEERYRKGILIVTSQVDPKGWKKLFEDPVIAESVTDRMINPSKLIELKGPSFRERLKIDS
jgi:DNA replication protein DnaC